MLPAIFNVALQSQFFYVVLTVGWEFPVYNVTEAEGEVEICALRERTLQPAAIPRISVLTADGTATASKNAAL